MKKIILAMMILSLLISVPVFAQETTKEELPFQGTPAGTSQTAGSGMSLMAQSPTVIPVTNGVIVLSGTKLLKYDNDLNLIKEVKIPISSDDKREPLVPKSPEKDALTVTTQSQEAATVAEPQETTI